MAGSVKFEDNSIEVKAKLDKAIIAFLNEAAGEVLAATKRNSRVDSGETKNSYEYNLNEQKDGAEAKIGSNLENAIYEEFGTGEYALNGDGRIGGWSYEDINGEWHTTRGKQPNRPLFSAYVALRAKIIKRAEAVIGAHMK